MNMKRSKIIIFGAGPAGLGAAIELVKNDLKPIILEKENQAGGISKTINYKGYYFDLGGHRFFTKSPEVMNLWQEILKKEDFLERQRLSRIYYKNKFFFYPLKPFNALFNLGFFTSLQVVFSYLISKIFPFKEEKTFEQWVSNRFGKKLFNIFFKTYTEKVWGIPCQEISAQWAAQRIKGLSLFSAIKNAFFPQKSGKIKTLITSFHYPKFGPGMMYEKMAKRIEEKGGNVFLNEEIKKIYCSEKNILKVITEKEGVLREYEGDYFISTLPINFLVKIMDPLPPKEILEAANNLKFRSFLVVNLILEAKDLFPDNWIYVHSPEVKMGRIQNFKNWSPFMVKNENETGLGLEYFCTEGDEFWRKTDEELIKIGIEELEKIKIAKKFQFKEGFVVRVLNAYPVYFTGYENYLNTIKYYLAGFKNLQTIGRAGMFRYNNMDHSILSGIYAASNILGKKNNIWEINIEEEYHEEIKRQ